MQVGLTQHIHTSFMVSGEESRRKKRVIIAGVMSNDDVLFHWNNLAIDIRAIANQRECNLGISLNYG